MAAELRAAIISGQSAPDTPLPSEDRLAARHGVSRVTIRAALALLRSEGLITTVTGGATYIRDRRPVRLSLSRYARTLHPGPPGPFSAAAQASGLVGHVQIIHVERHPADTATRVHAAFLELGITPTTMTEEVSTRMPTPEEAETLGLASGMPVLDIQRITRDQDNRPIELLRVVATGDRAVLVYDDLPITPT